ncbi:hypothetical protein G8O24_00005 [Bradyrhizobium sp. INPA01-394B]|uniref:Oxidoreductase n=1 Tax=Bradyrhizobium campsiandrae TaxID=1729892 RepID=A0ABR7UC83_9BRAD|nr:hypothetical protein [Bradyrhizobium campsiandrae]MBC9981713.1 hypothetical protein [Bradyrhizobium campsiandrae]
MTRLFASASMKTLIVVFSLAAIPAVSFAQGSAGSGGGSTGGVANAPASPPGTNSLGTAQSSGANTAPGVTTGAASPANAGADATVGAENRLLDKKIKSICRGC